MTTQAPAQPSSVSQPKRVAWRHSFSAKPLEFRRYGLPPSIRRVRTTRRFETQVILFVQFVIRLPLAIALAALSLVFRRLRLQLVRFPTFAFGHLILEPDLFLKKRLLSPEPGKRYLWIRDRQPVANRALLNLWRRRISNIRLPWIDLSRPPFRILLGQPDVFVDTRMYIGTVDDTGRFGEIQARWGRRPPLLELPAEVKRRGEAFLSTRGVPANAWFACIHCRESGYHAKNVDQRFRDGRIATYVSAIDFVLSRGGWVIRVGDPSMERLLSREGVIDLAHDPIRTEELDLFFAAECRYFLGGCSGPPSLAAAFGRPMAMANCLPLSTVPFYCHHGLGLGLPKLLREGSTGRVLGFREIMESDVSNFRFQVLYDRADLEIIDNDEDDILSLAQELHAMADGTLVLSADDRALQSRVKAMFRPGHYGYGSDCLFSPAFLRKYRDLVIEDPVS